MPSGTMRSFPSSVKMYRFISEAAVNAHLKSKSRGAECVPSLQLRPPNPS
jgi:hypothetical protein